MNRVYQLLSTQAQFFAGTWDSEPSGTLPLIFGYSYGIGPFTPHLATLPLPSVPTADYLRLDHDWRHDNARRVELAWKFLGENELLDLLYTNVSSVEFNRYNLRVYVGGGEKWGHFGGLEGATCVVAQWTLGRHQKSCIPVWVALRQLWLPLGNRALLPAGRRCSL